MRQYSLLDLMYWTAFLAAVLGVLATIEAEPLTVVILLIWLGGTIVARQFFGNLASYLGSVACAALMTLRNISAPPPSVGEIILGVALFAFLLGTMVWGGVAGATLLLSFAKRLPSKRFQLEGVLLAALIIAGLCALVGYGLRPYGHVCTFQVDAHREIIMTYDRGLCEGSLPIHYEFHEEGKTVVRPHTCTSRPCGIVPSTSDFRMLRLSDTKVAIQERSSEGKWETIILHDFATGQSFPENTNRDKVLADIERSEAQ